MTNFKRFTITRVLGLFALLANVAAIAGDPSPSAILNAGADAGAALTLPAGVSASLDDPNAPRKIVLLFSDTGAGHKTAAEGLRKMIKAKYPNATIVSRNIWEFSPTWLAKLKKPAWNFVLKQMPWVRDKGYLRTMEAGRRVESLKQMTTYHRAFNTGDVFNFISKENPDSVIATNYSGAEILRVIRDDGGLKDVNVGWVMTDYADGYWPRVSQYLDKTFLPHASMAKTWTDQGVPASKILVTGIPARPILPVNRATVLAAEGLDPKIMTVVLTGGSDGAAPYTEIVKKLVASHKGPMNIIAVAARNETELKSLEKLAPTLPPEIKLVPKGFIKNVTDLVQSADVYVSKAGGLSTTEGFLMKTPMVVYAAPGGGVEQINLKFFDKEKLALTAAGADDIAAKTMTLLTHKDVRDEILAAQAEYRKTYDVQQIADFAGQARPSQRALAQASVASLNAGPGVKPVAAVTAAATHGVGTAAEAPGLTGKLLDSDALAFQARSELIKNAKHEIDYATFLFRDDEVGRSQLSLLRDAARRGVKVRLLLDGQGGRKLPAGAIQQLINEGVAVKVYNPQSITNPKAFDIRMHDKFMSVDGKDVIVGGRNSWNNSYGLATKPGARVIDDDDLELLLRTDKTEKVENLKNYFTSLWTGPRSTDGKAFFKATGQEVLQGEALLNGNDLETVGKRLGINWEHSALDGGSALKSARLTYSDAGVADVNKGISKDLVDMLKSAKTKIKALSPYLILPPSWTEALTARKAAGVAIDLTTNSVHNTDAIHVMSVYRLKIPEMRRAGFTLGEYQGPKMLHTKALTVDGTKHYVGSFNIDNRSHAINSENGALVEGGEEFNKKMAAYYEWAAKNTKPITGTRAPAVGDSCVNALGILARFQRFADFL